MIASRLCHRRTAQAWDRWADEVVKAQRKRYLVEKAVGRWANAAVSIFFQMWADALERECRRRQINWSFAPVRVPIGGPTPTTQFSPDIKFTFCKQTPSTEKKIANEGCPFVGSKKKGTGSSACCGEIKLQRHKRTTSSIKTRKKKKANVYSCFILNFQI